MKENAILISLWTLILLVVILATYFLLNSGQEHQDNLMSVIMHRQDTQTLKTTLESF